MNPIEFERGLKVGDVVEARWTNSYRNYQVKAEIKKLNEKSFVVKLLVDVMDGDKVSYRNGYDKIRLPRMLSREWSMMNGVFPLESESGGPRYRLGHTIPGRGKVKNIFLTQTGYDYEVEP